MEAVEEMAPKGQPLPGTAVHAPVHVERDRPIDEPKKPGGHGSGDTEARGQKRPMGHTAQVEFVVAPVAFE